MVSRGIPIKPILEMVRGGRLLVLLAMALDPSFRDSGLFLIFRLRKPIQAVGNSFVLINTLDKQRACSCGPLPAITSAAATMIASFFPPPKQLFARSKALGLLKVPPAFTETCFGNPLLFFCVETAPVRMHALPSAMRCFLSLGAGSYAGLSS